MSTIALLGDSIFDNASYVKNGQDVCSQLRARLGRAHQAVLFALDGAVLADVPDQIDRVLAMTERPDHLFVSCGGNDVLALAGGLQTRVASLMEGMSILAQWQAGFKRAYCAMLDELAACRIPFTVSTIYDAVPGLVAGQRTALAVFNDVITVEAARRSVRVLDLRFVCARACHFSGVSPIEPSEEGGAKIAEALAALATAPLDASSHTILYASLPGIAQ